MTESPIRMTKEEYERRKAKVLKLRKRVLTIVEDLIEPDVDEQTLIENCKHLCKSDYYDVTVERSIQNYCGYPICANGLADLSKKRQQYKICLNTHQVFDITDRKMFCSNLCFTSSNYLKDQLDEEPLWFRDLEERKSTKTNFHLYKKAKGSPGDEVKLDIDLTKDLIHELHKEGDSLRFKLYCTDCCSNTVERNECRNANCVRNKTTGVQLDKSINFPYIQEDDLNSLKDKLKNLKIKEKTPNLARKANNSTVDSKPAIRPILDKVVEKMDKISL